MNKYTTIALWMGVFLFVMYLVTGVEGASSSNISLPSGESSFDAVNALSMARTFFAVLSFRLENVPTFINVLLYPFIFGIAYMIIDTIRGSG